MKTATYKILFALSLMFGSLHADYIYENDLILTNTPSVNYDEFKKGIETLGKEVSEKTSWNIYLVLKKEIGATPMIDYQKELSVHLKAPFVLLTIAEKEKKYGIYGSEGYREQFDINEIRFDIIEPLLGDKVKGDPRAKYLVAMHEGYTEIAEQIAAKQNVKLVNAVGNTNRVMIKVLKFGLYGFILIVASLFFYKKIIKRSSK